MALPACDCGGDNNGGTTNNDTTNNGTVNNTTGTNNDNNGAEPSVTVSKTDVQTTEAGGTDTFTVVLGSEPAEDVTITVASSVEEEATVAPATLTFTSDNWDTPQTVTVTGVDDDVADGNQDYTITMTAASDDEGYDGFNVPSVSGTNVDDDMATLEVSATSVTVSEDGTTATFDVTIGAAPSDDVTISLTASDDTQITTDVASLTFAAGTANTTQTVTITATDDDLVEGLHNVTLALDAASADAAYDAIDPTDVSVSIVDNDMASIAVTPAALTISESGNTMGTFEITLGTAPTDTVTIDLTSSDTSEATVSPAQVTLDANTLSATVTVTAVDDADVDGAQLITILTADAASNDSAYDGATVADVPVTVLDNDAAAINVVPTALTVAENAGQGTFDVSLSAAPVADVVVDIASSNPADIGLSSTSLTFSSANWMTAQTVTVTGTDDGLAEGTEVATLNTTVATQDAAYQNINPDNVVVTITDDDVAGVVVSPTVLAVSETGTTATFTVVLGSAPTDDVVVGVVSSDTTEATVSTASLTFTPQNFASPQTVTVTGVDDNEADGTTTISVATTITSNDAQYGAINPADVTVTVADDDAPGVNVTPQSLTLLEGDQGTATVSLSSAPSGTVTIALTSTDAANVTVSPASLTFNATNFATPQTVTFTAVDDLLADGPQVVSITTTATSADSAYNGIAVPDFSVRANDNDQADFTVTPTTGLSTSEAGGTATFTVALTAQPSANVTLPVSVSDSTEGSITSTVPLVFNASNWQTGLQVTVAGVDDNDKDGAVTYQALFAAATSTDSAYAGRAPASVNITNFDNEAGFTVRTATGNNLLVSESGTTDTFTVVLNSAPQQNVQLVLLPDGNEGDEYDVTPQQFVFTPQNWSTPQTATVAGLPDQDIDGPQTWSIDVEVGNTVDQAYAALADVATVNGQTTDADAAGVVVTPNSISLVEGGSSTFDIVLNQPANNTYTIALTSSDPQVTVTPATVTFTPGETTETVTVTATQDTVLEAQKAVTITTAAIVSSNTSDPYHNINPADVAVTVDDDEQASLVIVTEQGVPFNKRVTFESGITSIIDEFTVRLASAPTASVVVTITSSDPSEGILSKAGGVTGASITLVFQPADWQTPQNILVVGVDDDLQDGPVEYSINFGVTSTDTFYDGITTPSLPAENLDDDTPGWLVVADELPIPVSENGTSRSYLVVMSGASNSPVNVTVASSDTGEATVSPTSASYPSGCDTGCFTQFTVTGVNDNIVDGPQAVQITQQSLSTTDPFYVTTTFPTINVVNDDNDGAAFTVASFESSMDEDDTESFTVRLASQPSADVTVTVGSSDTTEATVSPTTLTFTTANWNSPQTVTVDALDDNVIDGDIDVTISLTASSTDSDYNNLTDERLLTVFDIHTPGIDYEIPNGLQVSESGTTRTILVRLDTQPTANVTIPVYSFDTTEVTVSVNQLVFTPQNWDQQQTVTLTGVDDLVVDGNQNALIVFDISTSADPNYDGLTFSQFNATNLDDEEAGVSVLQPTAPSYVVTDESGLTDTFQVVLNTAPASGKVVKIDFTTHVWPSGGSAATGRATVTPSVTFTDANWNVPQTVTVTGENNLSTEPFQYYYVQGTVDAAAMNADAVYNGIFIEQVLGLNIDNDEEAIVLLGEVFGVTGSTSSIAAQVALQQAVFTGENGATGTFYLRGTDLPTANVPVALSIDNGEATVPATVTLTQANYRNLNAITVTGQDPDNTAEGTGFTAFTLTANPDNASGDANYASLANETLNGFNIDDDQCRLVAFPATSASSRLLGREGVITPYLLFIGADPLQPVGIDLASSGQGFTPTETLTLSSGGAHRVINTYPDIVGDNLNGTYQVDADVVNAGACYAPAASLTTFGLRTELPVAP